MRNLIKSQKQAQSQGSLSETGSGKVLLVGLKGDSLTITFYSESLRRQFKYHLLKGNAKQFSLGCYQAHKVTCLF